MLLVPLMTGLTKFEVLKGLRSEKEAENEQGQVGGTEMKKIVTWALLLILVSLVACTPTVQEASNAVVLASGETLQSEKMRIEAPEVLGDDKTALTDGNGAFAFALYQQLKDEGSNLFFSPHSISTALAMTYVGARSTTEKQMAKALHFDLPQQKLHPAFNWLEQQLASRGKGAKGKDEEGFRLKVANSIWAQQNFEFMVAFLDTLAENYGAGLRILDFSSEPEPSRIIINQWVSDQTEDKIGDLIPKGAITERTCLVLANAIYFNAAWKASFSKEATQDLPFYLLNGESISVPMMRQTISFGYTEGDGYQAVELPYDGEELSMVILLPAKGNFNDFENNLSFQQADSIIGHLKKAPVYLKLPKFELLSPTFNLNQALSALGMPDAFTLDADFSGMTGNKGLFISDVIHKAFVSVDEGGTEAAAATAVIVGKSIPVPSSPVEVTIDHPFIFLIRDVNTGAILFIGRVLNPGG